MKKHTVAGPDLPNGSVLPRAIARKQQDPHTPECTTPLAAEHRTAVHYTDSHVPLDREL